MFNVADKQPIKNDRVRPDEALTNRFTDFIELRYGFDPIFEAKVVSDLIVRLSMSLIHKHGNYVTRLWMQRYDVSPLELKPQDGYESSDYADQLATMFKIYECNNDCEFEMIRMLICYTKLKNIDIQNIFSK